MIAFSKHESLTLPHLANGLWLTLLRSPVISMDTTFQAVFPSLLDIAKAKLFKVGHPEEEDSPGSVFNREDFNSEREFTSVNGQVRGEVMDIIRHLTMLHPVATFLYGADWLLQRVSQTPAPDVKISAQETEKMIQEWDGLTRYLDAVMSRFFKVDNYEEIIHSQVTFRGTSVTFVELVRECIQAALNVDSKVPDILSSVTDAIQALYPFLKYSKDLLMDVLKKMFQVVLFNTTGEPKGPWSPDVLHARRHACGAIIKICKEFGELLVPVFDALKEHIQSLFVGELVPVKDRCTLTEALVIASNKLSKEKQNEFLVQLLTPVREMWLGEKIQGAISSPGNFVSFIGMDQDPSGYFQNDELRGRRFQIMYAVTTIMAVVRSCAMLNTKTAAAGEGLSIGSMPNGTPYVHNPCASHVIPLLGNIILLANCLNRIHNPSVKAAIFPEYLASLGMHDLDTSAIYVLPQGQENKDKGGAPFVPTPISVTKGFLYHLADSCISGLAQLLVDNLVKSLQHVPNYRLRFVVRNFFKLFILHCPQCDYQNVLVPVLSPFFGHMLQHLEEQWQMVRQHQAESVNMQMLITVFACLTWPDSAVCHKATRLATTFLKEVMMLSSQAGSRIADSVVEQLFSQVLKGLHVHGHGSTETYLTYVGQNMYELLRPQYSSLQQLLLQTNCSLEDLHAFEASCLEGREVPEKRKKEQFKKIVSGIVGKHIGELFKNEIRIKDLPPIKIKPKPEPKGYEDPTGLADLFDPSKTSESH
ncbi:hypothetical protein pdam_00003840 [Pocillopora damicornis]|uniref:Exportin-5 C-terminal domain-containing protein n=1 Tax=Pocillopora damicornis TaxID=46731 RepID=A0A3M6T4D4_POCDA|nr:hypothetical protein pdam_00003840 [Pocillopora damicornis]